MVTLSAPFRLTNGATKLPETVLEPEGVIDTEVYEAEPVPLAFKTAEAVSTGSQLITMVIAP